MYAHVNNQDAVCTSRKFLNTVDKPLKIIGPDHFKDRSCYAVFIHRISSKKEAFKPDTFIRPIHLQVIYVSTLPPPKKQEIKLE